MITTAAIGAKAAQPASSESVASAELDDRKVEGN